MRILGCYIAERWEHDTKTVDDITVRLWRKDITVDDIAVRFWRKEI